MDTRQTAAITQNVTRTYFELGESAFKAGDFQLAQKMFTACLEQPGSPYRNTCFLPALDNMASVFLAQGRLYKAKITLVRALAHCKKTLGKNHIRLVETLLELARISAQQRLYRDCKEYLNQAREISFCSNEDARELFKPVLKTIRESSVQHNRPEFALLIDSFAISLEDSPLNQNGNG